jgi:hypothetical protein
MTYQHPITPPPELVQQWTHGATEAGLVDEEIFAARAAQWGADQELEACCEWLRDDGWCGSLARLRAARRPKPPSLAGQGVEALSGIVDALQLGFPGASVDGVHIQTLTAALNRLAELEQQATP